jgi:hypothetical protein
VKEQETKDCALIGRLDWSQNDPKPTSPQRSDTSQSGKPMANAMQTSNNASSPLVDVGRNMLSMLTIGASTKTQTAA